ncbi:hypothetical protein ACSTIN_12880 [Vibrio parahaemolyticus]
MTVTEYTINLLTSNIGHCLMLPYLDGDEWQKTTDTILEQRKMIDLALLDNDLRESLSDYIEQEQRHINTVLEQMELWRKQYGTTSN